MPELAELKLTSEYINKATSGRTFNAVKKNPQHKGELFDIPFESFTISSLSRGKELVVSINDLNSTQTIPIRWTMGMSGHFRLSKTGEENKHAHIMFTSLDGHTLSFVDVRRFGKWKPGFQWSENRGPCPMTQFREFKQNVIDNLHKKEFDKPINVVLMNQKYFNGIGNYLRAEILYRMKNAYPFMESRQFIDQYGDELFMLCKAVPELAYIMGGGEIKDWKNPFKNETDYIRTRSSFFLCYGNETMAQVVDKTKRRFWYDPKWNKLDMDSEWDYYSGLPNPKAYENI
jgi:endonuclease VIII-like 1